MTGDTSLASFAVIVMRYDGKTKLWGTYDSRSQSEAVAERLRVLGIAAKVVGPEHERPERSR